MTMNSSTPNNTNNATSTSPNTSFNLEGRILRKKNISAEHLKLAIQRQNHEKSTTIYIPRKDDFASANLLPSEVNFLYLDSVIRVQGFVNENGFHHVTSCRLVKCAPNTKLLKDLLALPNYLSFASTLGFGNEEEMKRHWVEQDGSTKSKKTVVNGIIEKLTGKRAKAPPRYRKARVKRFDLSILESKEAEGRRLAEGNGSGSHDNGSSNDRLETDPMKLNWTLCQPCSIQPLNNNEIDLTNATPTSHDDEDHREESNNDNTIAINLPTGASNSVSAHGKLTRSEYLETKKNHQSMWFVQRVRKFRTPPTRFLDVGGGRGDLAVALARHFPKMEGVVVDSNASSVEAGREYARMCGVGDRIEFVCMDFTSYIRQYDNDNNNNNSDGNDDDVSDANSNNNNKDQRHKPVDFVVALHACGDLSDMALSFASSHSCDFIVCPCCYVKRYLAPFTPHWHTFCTHQEVDSLSRLVELDDQREVSRRAMLVVNSMRRNAFEEREDEDGVVDGRKRQETKVKRKRRVVLEEFDNRISRRNIALVGTVVSS